MALPWACSIQSRLILCRSLSGSSALVGRVSVLLSADVVTGLWLGNLLKWAGAPSPLPRYNKAEVEVVEAAEAVEAVEVAVPDSTVVE